MMPVAHAHPGGLDGDADLPGSRALLREFENLQWLVDGG